MPSGINASVNAIKSMLTSRAVRANNVANVNTRGFKSKRAIVSENQGNGPSIKSVDTDFSQGTLKHTGLNADVAISGPGFFQLESVNGAPVYKRHLNLHLDVDEGYIFDNTGNRIPGVKLQEDFIEGMKIKQDGTILAIENTGEVKEIGRLLVVGFQNVQGLLQDGEGVFRPSPDSGKSVVTNDGYKVLQGFEESGNVSLAQQIAGQMVDEKMIKANVSTVQTQDQMLGDLLDLKG